MGFYLGKDLISQKTAKAALHAPRGKDSTACSRRPSRVPEKGGVLVGTGRIYVLYLAPISNHELCSPPPPPPNSHTEILTPKEIDLKSH